MDKYRLRAVARNLSHVTMLTVMAKLYPIVDNGVFGDVDLVATGGNIEIAQGFKSLVVAYRENNESLWSILSIDDFFLDCERVFKECNA